jgi:outer membrane immunogenic protein
LETEESADMLIESTNFRLGLRAMPVTGGNLTKFLLITACTLLCLTEVTYAGDAIYQPPLEASGVYNWSGWYAGLTGGGDWGTSRTSTAVGNGTKGIFFIPTAVSSFNALGAPANFSTSGSAGGVFGGYNYQMGRWLLGVDADLEYYRSAGSNSVTGTVAGGLPATITSSTNTDLLFTLRPRLGIVLDHWLFYGTGGLAVTRLSANWSFLQTVGATVTENAAISGLQPGWAAGGGVETALPGNFTLGVEYLHADFGSVSTNTGAFNVAGVGTVTNPIRQSASLQTNIILLRVSKLF